MKAKFILDEDMDKYGEFFAHHYRGLTSTKLDFPLYHYTTGDNLIKIIESGHLWATQIAFLNDSNELLYSIELFQQAIDERRYTSVNEEFAQLLSKMDEILVNSSPETSGVYVICFSKRRNDLSQWRAYGGSEGGYAIEFNFSDIRDKLLKEGKQLVPVTYGGESIEKILADVIKFTEKFFMDGVAAKRAPSLEEWVEDFSQFWLWHLSFFASIFKSPAFKDEEEWRLIYRLANEDIPRMGFSQSRSMLRSHLPLSFSPPNGNGYSPLPITEVMVGPTNYKRHSQVGVGDLLRSNGYGTEDMATVTDIPFRNDR